MPGKSLQEPDIRGCRRVPWDIAAAGSCYDEWATHVTRPDPPSSPHAFSTAVVAELLDVDVETGLSSRDVADRRRRYGANLLPGPPRRSLAKALFPQVANFLILLLLIAAAIAVAVDELVQAGTILAIVVLTGVLGF